LEHLTRAFDEWTALADAPGLSSALDDLGQVLWLLGRTDEALDHAGRALELRRRQGDRRQVATSLLHIGAIEQHRGLLDHAVGCFEEAQRKHDGDPQLLGACMEALGSVALLRGDVATARTYFEQGLAHIEPLGPSPLHAVLACRLGEAMLQEGDLELAHRQLQSAHAVAQRLSDRRALAEIQRLLALVLLRRDDQAAALDCAQRALEQAQRNGVRHEIARALLTLGEVHAATLFDETAEGAHPAWDCFRRSVALLREVGDQAELALALYQLARHLIERGRLGPARHTLREAEQLAAQLKMGSAAEMRHMLTEL
jgi:tetratricopeptide (TPR) repeat protein